MAALAKHHYPTRTIFFFGPTVLNYSSNPEGPEGRMLAQVADAVWAEWSDSNTTQLFPAHVSEYESIPINESTRARIRFAPYRAVGILYVQRCDIVFV